MKTDVKKTRLSFIMMLVKEDFLGHDALRHWLSLPWLVLKCFVCITFLWCGGFGLLVLMLTAFAPESFVIELSNLGQSEVVALMRMIRSGFISAMLTMALPFSVIITVFITFFRYEKKFLKTRGGTC